MHYRKEKYSFAQLIEFLPKLKTKYIAKSQFAKSLSYLLLKLDKLTLGE